LNTQKDEQKLKCEDLGRFLNVTYGEWSQDYTLAKKSIQLFLCNEGIGVTDAVEEWGIEATSKVIYYQGTVLYDRGFFFGKDFT
jgi:hypothetical protein